MSETQNTTRRWLLLATVCAGVFLITLDNTVLYTALPRIVRDLDATAPQMLWIINAYPVVICGLLLGTGTLGDKLGHRRLFITGLIIFGIASLVGGLSPNVGVLIGARGALALGAATMMPATLALIRHTFHTPKEMNLAIGIWSAVSTVAAALGPLIGGLLLEYFSWGSVFFVNIPIVVLALIAIPFVTEKDNPKPDLPWDVLSVLLAMVSLISLVMAIKQLAHTPIPWGVAAASFALFLLAGWAFIRRQGTLEEPLLTFDLFRNPLFLAGVYGASLSLFAVVGFQFLTTQRLQLVDGVSPLHAGLYVTVAAVGSLISSIVAGKWLDRIGTRPLLSGGLFLGAGASALIALGSHLEHNLPTLIGLLLLGFGLGATMAAASIGMIGSAPPERAGMASSVEEVSYEFGALLSVAVLGSAVTALYSFFYDANPPANLPNTDHEFHNPALSLQDALQYSQGMRDKSAMQELLSHANAAYINGYTVTSVLVVLVLLGGAIYTHRLLGTKQR